MLSQKEHLSKSSARYQEECAQLQCMLHGSTLKVGEHEQIIEEQVQQIQEMQKLAARMQEDKETLQHEADELAAHCNEEANSVEQAWQMSDHLRAEQETLLLAEMSTISALKEMEQLQLDASAEREANVLLRFEAEVHTASRIGKMWKQSVVVSSSWKNKPLQLQKSKASCSLLYTMLRWSSLQVQMQLSVHPRRLQHSGTCFRKKDALLHIAQSSSHVKLKLHAMRRMLLQGS